MGQPGFSSCFEQVFDVAIYGCGYGALAAALASRARGASVVLISRDPDLLWESGRCFGLEAGTLAEPLWQQWQQELAGHGGAGSVGDARTLQFDGAIAEVLATTLLQRQNVAVLYYASPVAATCADSALAGLTLATKAGLKQVLARQWIDASETGEVARLLEAKLSLRQPAARQLALFYQQPQWPAELPAAASAPELPGATLAWQNTLWPSQRALTVTLPGGGSGGNGDRAALLPALQAGRAQLGEECRAVVSHLSVRSLPNYAAAAAATDANAPARNLTLACPALTAGAVTNLAQRFALGLRAAQDLQQRPRHEPSAALRSSTPVFPTPVAKEQAQVVVAGAGTGGALAAIAASRAGASVLCFDVLPFPGGIGAGGGIHWYYLGVAGGLQKELDEQVHQIMPLLGPVKQVQGFHPDAKKLALERLFHQANIHFLPGHLLYSTQRQGRRIEAVLLAGSAGATQVRGQAFVDATGDGDLCAQAGAAYLYGRTGDGLPHAYSQSGGRIGERDGLSVMGVINYDAGWVDPTDSEDLTRGRLTGIAQYLRARFENHTRPTYIAPAIGLRQSRQIVTDYAVTLSDIVERRRFADFVGFTGAHYDNHAVDYEFETDEAVLWVWVCRQWRTSTACQIPYRMLLPRDLDNAWIGCRAAGVTQDAHHSFRMQRDMQRLGEISGLAAALSLAGGGASRQVDIAALQRELARSGAVDLSQADHPREFGPIIGSHELADPQQQQRIDEGLAALSRGEAGGSLWWLYRHRQQTQAAVMKALRDPQPAVSFLAASIAALWGEPAAEERLLQAIATREYGFGQDDKLRPETNNRLVSHWVLAVTLLRCCGSGRSVAALAELARRPGQSLNLRTGIACTLERMVQRGVDLPGAETAALLESLLADAPADGHSIPQRTVQNLINALDAQAALPASKPEPTAEDHHWQLALVVGRVQLALGLPVHSQAQALAGDGRRLVRSAWARAVAQVRQPAGNAARR